MLTFKSPAKVNLFLRITGKRPDHYHEIKSLFQAIDLFDYLTFTPSTSDLFTTQDSTLPSDERNLVIKALHLFRKKTGNQQPFHIYLEKNIPSEAGLGGGSGNAATTLYALNHLTQSPVSTEELALWSSEIGSDIPFFFSHGTAFCQGRGEIVRNINAPLSSYTLCKPTYGLSTPSVYKALNLSLCSEKDPEELLESFINGNPDYCNDLEPPAFTLCPPLSSFKEALQEQGFKDVIMSGSGSSFISSSSSKTPQSFHFTANVNGIKRSQHSWY